jgi:hypothetical protein
MDTELSAIQAKVQGIGPRCRNGPCSEQGVMMVAVPR